MSTSHKRDIVVKGGRNRSPRPKTFKTEDAAKQYAESKGMKDYELVKLRMGLSPKIKIVEKA